MLKREDIRVRDPYIVIHDGKYYMYATSNDTTLSYYVSRNLENCEDGGVVFEIPENFWAYKDVLTASAVWHCTRPKVQCLNTRIFLKSAKKTATLL